MNIQRTVLNWKKAFIKLIQPVVTSGGSWAIKKGTNYLYLKKYNDAINMTKLEIDTENRTVHVILQLEGELSPIELTGTYNIEKRDDGNYLLPKSVQSSRIWMEKILNQAIKDNNLSFKLDGWANTASSVLGIA